MTPIYSSSALKTRQREVKDAALKSVVHITENGNGAFVFCSEEIFEGRLKQVAEQAAYEERMRAAIERGRADYAAGRCVEGIDAAFAKAEQLRASHG